MILHHLVTFALRAQFGSLPKPCPEQLLTWLPTQCVERVCLYVSGKDNISQNPERVAARNVVSLNIFSRLVCDSLLSTA